MAANPDKIRKEAMKAIAKGDLGRALESYQQLLRLTPEDTKVWVSVGDICRKLGESAQAVRFYANAAKKYALAGQLLQAISINKIILEIDPGHKQTQRALARLYADDGEKRVAAPPTPKPEPQRGPVDHSGGIDLTFEDETTAQEEAPEPMDAPEQTPPDSDNLFGDFLDAEEAELMDDDLSGLISQMPTIPIFSDLDSGAFEAVIDQLFHLTFGPGDMIVSEGDPGDSFYVICEGSARVVKTSPEGQAVELATLNTGDFFGEFAYITGTPRTASIMANDAISLLEFNRKALKSLENANPKITETLELFYKKRLVGTVLKISPLMQPLDTEQRNELIRAFEPRQVQAGEVLIRQAEPVDALYLVVSGNIDVSATGEDGDTIEIATLGVGEFFGEIGMITGKSATATCTASSPCNLYQLSNERFQLVLKKYPQLADIIKETAKKRFSELKQAVSQPEAQLAEAGLV